MLRADREMSALAMRESLQQQASDSVDRAEAHEKLAEKLKLEIQAKQKERAGHTVRLNSPHGGIASHAGHPPRYIYA